VRPIASPRFVIVLAWIHGSRLTDAITVAGRLAAEIFWSSLQ